MLNATTSNHRRPVIEAASGVMRVGPLSLQVNGTAIIDHGDGEPTLGLPFTHGFFLAACGYRTWDFLRNLDIAVYAGWTRITGNAINYGCWVDVDADAARVLARLAGQELLIELTPTALRISTGEPDGPVVNIDLTTDDRSVTEPEGADAGGSPR